MDETQPGSVIASGGGVGTDDTTLAERVDPSSFVAAGGRMLVHLNNSFSMVCGSSNMWRETQLQRKKEAGKLQCETWPDFKHFQIWRINFRSEESSSASRSVEAMDWIKEIESAKSVAAPHPVPLHAASRFSHHHHLHSASTSLRPQCA